MYDYAQGNVGGVTTDWSRVVAVRVDEPYGALDGPNPTMTPNPCLAGPDSTQMSTVNSIGQQLQA